MFTQIQSNSWPAFFPYSYKCLNVACIDIWECFGCVYVCIYICVCVCIYVYVYLCLYMYRGLLSYLCEKGIGGRVWVISISHVQWLAELYVSCLIYAFEEFFASINKIFIFAGGLSAGLLFNGVLRLSWYFLIS